MVSKTSTKAKDPTKCIPGTGAADLRDGAIPYVPPPQVKVACENEALDAANGEVCLVNSCLYCNCLKYAFRRIR